jgi:hypothetical protein
MTADEFVDCVRTEVIDGTNSAYTAILQDPCVDRITDEYWKQVVQLYSSLDESGRAVIRRIMKQASIDAVSGVFAILDGVTILDECRGDFVLSYDEGPPLNGSLADLFLAQ